MSTITTINDSDVVGNSNETINTNFSNLNTDKVEKSNNLSDLTNASTARTNLGLGNSATKDVGTGASQVAAGDHTHAHSSLSGIGTNTHAQIDSHISIAFNGRLWRRRNRPRFRPPL